MTRRRLLQALPLAAAVSACRTPPYRASDFVVMDRSPVALLDAPRYDVGLDDVILRGLGLIGADVKGRRVFLKPNLVEYAPGAPINTHPAVVAGAATAFLRAGAASVVVGEGPGHRRDLEYLLTATGLHDHLTDLRLRFVDLNHADVRVVPLGSRFTGLESLALPRDLLESDFLVTMPKLKTHHWAGMTAGMKNLFGTVPGAVYGWPKNLLHFRGIENSILDLAATLRPALAIVDGIVAMEGDGPIMGRPRETGFLAMGPDVVAVDSACARAMGLDPSRITYLREASRFLGNLDDGRIEHRGEDPGRYRFTFDLLESFLPLRLPTT